jgi:hypothetical protein
MEPSRLFTKSVAIVLAMVIGLTFSPVKTNAESGEGNDQHITSTTSDSGSSSTSNSSSTGLIVGGVVVVGLLSYFFLFRDTTHKTAATNSDIYRNVANNSSTEKEHSNKSILFEHESPFLVASQAK